MKRSASALARQSLRTSWSRCWLGVGAAWNWSARLSGLRRGEEPRQRQVQPLGPRFLVVHAALGRIKIQVLSQLIALGQHGVAHRDGILHAVAVGAGVD